MYGLDNKAKDWFGSYLKDRHFQIIIENELSCKTPINSGVPQGSILGSLLFMIHMNDLPLHLNESYIDLFADDTTQYTSSGTMSRG